MTIILTKEDKRTTCKKCKDGLEDHTCDNCLKVAKYCECMDCVMNCVGKNCKDVHECSNFGRCDEAEWIIVPPPIIYQSDKPIEFIGNRNMIKWLFDTTVIPHELIYHATMPKERYDEWFNNPKSIILFDEVTRLCRIANISSAIMFLDDNELPSKELTPPDTPIIEGRNYIISEEEIARIKYGIDKALKSDDPQIIKLALYQTLQKLKPYTFYLDF